MTITITFQVDTAPVKALEDREGEATSAIAVASSLAGQIQESVKRDIQQNKTALSHLKARKTELLRSIDEARAHVVEQQRKVDLQRTHLADNEQIQLTVQQQVDENRNETAQLESDIQLHRDGVAGVTAELDNVNQEIENVKTMIGVAIQEGELQVADLEAAIDEKKARLEEIDNMRGRVAARVEAEADALSREWFELDEQLKTSSTHLDELQEQYKEIVTAKQQELADWEAQKTALEAELANNRKQLSDTETRLEFQTTTLAKLESDEQALGAKWDAHVQAVVEGDAAITSAEAKVADIVAQTKNTEDHITQLTTDLEAAKGEVKRLQFTAGMVMTTIGMGFRITRRLFKGLNAQFDEAISYLASMFSHTATLAWQASAIAAGTGNVVMAAMHAMIATVAAAQGTAVLVERNQQRQQAEYNQEIYMGER